MALTQRLDLRQSQSLVMTPQLQQAIKLLQLSNLELGEYIESELEKNPMLERDEGDRDAEAPEEGASRDEIENLDALQSIDFDVPQKAEIEDDARDVDYDNIYTDDGPVVGGLDQNHSTSFSDVNSSGNFDPLTENLEETVSEKPSLREHLNSQLFMDIVDPVDRMIGGHLIDMLDEAGYFSGDLESVAQFLNCDVRRVEATLGKLQDFDPPGIFARSLSECLSLQLAEKNHLDPCMQTFLENLDLVAKRDFTELTRICNSDIEDVHDMIEEIKALDPKPALAFDQTITQPIIPDVLMRPVSGGGWIIELNSESLPKVLVNNNYYIQVSGQAHSKSEKQYISEQYNSANWLVKSLHQRATTILKVARELVLQQDLFFSKGVQFLKPLVLRDIAESIEMHESTVSRVTSNKYIATPRGIYELKYFFTSAIAATGGGVFSAESVRHRIKELIDKEEPKKILSDDKLVELLKAEGIEIARRTVAKYRESMKIFSSVQRRKIKLSPK
ncbi:MAG: RNA polymerase factor sigma-54 [Pseudomonadota bacterium]|nr:RNA polymerase factor sigma-54 [Pseudomonadota bacterium]